MVYPKIIRNRYRVGEKDSRQHSPYHLEEDFQYFHLPLSHLHQRHLHTWGICAGLEVRGVPGASLVTIQPGVAIDAEGRMIVLTDEGIAQTADDTVNKLPVELLLQKEGVCYVTLAYAEDEQPERPGTAGQTLPVNVLQRPFVGLEAVENFVDNGAALILALVEIDAAHRLVQISERLGDLFMRRLVGQSGGAIELRRPVTVDHQVTAVSAGTLTALPAGGVQLRVANSTDPIELSGADGHNFAELRLRAYSTQMQGSLTVQGALQVDATLQVEGATQVKGALAVDTITSGDLRIQTDDGSQPLLRVMAANQSQASVIHLLPDGGHVGIGTSAPKYPLDVHGRVNVHELFVQGKPLATLFPPASPWTTVREGIAYPTGNVGIGTSSPQYSLQIGDVVKGISFDTADVSPNAGYLRFGDNTGWKLHVGRSYEKVGATPNRGPVGVLMTIQDNGNIGIGATSPSAGLEINKGATNDLALLLSSSGPGWGSGLQLKNTAPNAKTYGIYSGTDGNLHFADQDNFRDRLMIGKDGNVTMSGTLGILGWSATPRTPGWGGGIHTWDVEAEGTIWSRNGYVGPNRDLAENYAATTALDAGDVVCLALGEDKVTLATKPNDHCLIGVVSTAPGVLLNENYDRTVDNLFPIALCGRVPCKVVDENGPIQRGDLLTSSSTPGHAMKAQPMIVEGHPIYQSGTILGKALAAHASGMGIIDIFVTTC